MSLDNKITVEEFDEFVNFCFEHGGTLRNHKVFGEMARKLRNKLNKDKPKSITRLVIPEPWEGQDGWFCSNCGVFVKGYLGETCWNCRKEKNSDVIIK